jgi:bla regulator protein blaR1
MKRCSVFAIVLIFSLVASAFAQDGVTPRPSFEVASIKPNSSGGNRVALVGQPGGRFVATNVTLQMLITIAYQVDGFRISGGPNWVNSDRFDIEARAEGGNTIPGQPFPLLQSLLEDRFGLKVPWETKEFPVYELVVAKNGMKLQAVADPDPLPPGGFRVARGVMAGSAVSFINFVRALSLYLGRTIVNKTALIGFFDIKLEWTPEVGEGGPFGPGGSFGPGPETGPPPSSVPGPSIFTAIQEQLGLRLESSKGPVDVLVIDSVERPSEN